ncbi:hypothetical protein QBC38DRAFT_462543 [Podospora fimiseda]|uniref:Uncharacterized protein n=1 Tax=Podospora fimiseda TaxID=252190 RepID=A0AAN6YKQ0_9PEZI|nr:hypothetical protein QBC38DRAFT_462543 [Podospora fimiseda]
MPTRTTTATGFRRGGLRGRGKEGDRHPHKAAPHRGEENQIGRQRSMFIREYLGFIQDCFTLANSCIKPFRQIGAPADQGWIGHVGTMVSAWKY